MEQAVQQFHKKLSAAKFFYEAVTTFDSNLVSELSLPADEVRDGLLKFIKRYNWLMEPKFIENELKVITQIMESKYNIVHNIFSYEMSIEIMKGALLTKCPFRSPAVHFLHCVLNIIQYPRDMNEYSELVERISVWLFGLSKLQSADVAFIGTISSWISLRDKIIAYNRKNETESCNALFPWLLNLYCQYMFNIMKVDCFKLISKLANYQTSKSPPNFFLEIITENMLQIAPFCHPNDIAKILFQSKILFKLINQKNFPSIHVPNWWQFDTIIKIMFNILKDIKTSPDQHPPVNFIDVLARSTIYDVFMNNFSIWTSFYVWFTTLPQLADQIDGYSKNLYDLSIFRKLLQLHKLLQKIFQLAITDIDSGTIKTHQISILYENRQQFEFCLSVEKQNIHMKTLIDMYFRMEELKQIVEQLKPFLEHYELKFSEATEVYRIEKNWHHFNIDDLEYLLGNFPERTVVYEDEVFTKLCPLLLKSQIWFNHLSASKLFNFIYQKYNEVTNISKLVLVSKEWEALNIRLNNADILFSELSELTNLLTKEELDFLSSTSKGFNETTVEWNILPIDAEWVIKIQKRIAAFEHLFTSIKQIDSIILSLQNISCLLQDDVKSQVEPYLQAAINLKKKIATIKEDNFKLRNISEYSEAGKIDKAYFTVSGEVFYALNNAPELLDWMLSLHNDKDFSTSIEIAMSKSEMECPYELWESIPGKPGRPDEKKLSMLSSVRAYLHPVLYYTSEKFDSYKELIKGLRLLLPSNPQIIEHINICNEFCIPLIELVGGDTDSNAANRLVQIYLPERRAKWNCSNYTETNSNSNSALWIHWTITRKAQSVTKKHNLEQLLDFQSSVVLAKSNRQVLVEKFITQFGWMRELKDVLSLLFITGHFDYQKYLVSFDLLQDANEIKERVLSLQETLKNWNDTLRSVRKKYYYFNYFTAKQLFRLTSHLSGESTDYAIHSELLSSVNIELGFDIDNYNSLIEFLEGSWNIFIAKNGETQRTASQLVEFCAQSLDTYFTKTQVQLRYRKIVSNYVVDNISQIQLVCVEKDRSIYEYILSAYFRQGYLPEKSEIVLCKNNTSVEEIETLLLRWEKSHLYHGQRLYCLAGIDALSFDVQKQVVSFIREAVLTAKSPLLILSNSSENQYMVIEYHHFKERMVPLEKFEIASLAKNYTENTHLYLSEYPGAGKTFQIRTQASKQLNEYIHVPVYNTNTSIAARLISLTTLYNLFDDRLLYHLDITESVPNEFSAEIFELTFFNSVEYHNGCYFINPANSMIAFEMTSRSHYDKFPSIQFLSRTYAETNESNFCSNSYDLLCGMGPNFDSSLNDGTKSDALDAANAHARLQYVCTILDIIDKNAGRFPYVPQLPNFVPLDSLRLSESIELDVNTNDIEADRCYQLLIKYSQFPVFRLSIYCIWNFINIMYWQLINLNDLNSAINIDCKPSNYGVNISDQNTMKPERTAELINKEKVKGEVIRFLCATARELSARQVVKDDPNQMVEQCILTGFRNSLLNGAYFETKYENDGKPCYRLGSHFLYFNFEEQRWEINYNMNCAEIPLAYSLSDSISGEWIEETMWDIDPTFKLTQLNAQIEITTDLHPNKLVTDRELGVYRAHPNLRNVYERKNAKRFLIYKSESSKYEITSSIEGPYEVYFRSTSFKKDRDWECRYSRAHCYVEHEYRYTPVENNRKSLDELLKWDDSNHEILLFCNKTKWVQVLGKSSTKLTESLHPILIDYFKSKSIKIGNNFSNLEEEHLEILKGLTGISRSTEEAKLLVGKNYCFTDDSIMKMLSIYIRVQCGVPVVLLGECGCGKTLLIRYLCNWLGIEFLVLDVHGGSTEEDFIQIFQKGDSIIKSGISREVYIFLDEVNTCPHMGLISQVICQRTIYDQRINENIKILAALNPYRLRPFTDKTTGLIYHQYNKSVVVDPMANLVYRVYPAPVTLREFIFDFGYLSPDVEERYIRSMTSDILGFILHENHSSCFSIVVGMLIACQQYSRELEQDQSAASLRDVKRALDLILWFFSKLVPKKVAENFEGNDLQVHPIVIATILGISFVYFYRIGSESRRIKLWDKVLSNVKRFFKSAKKYGFRKLSSPEEVIKVISAFQRKLCKKIQIEEGISLNSALIENIFVMLICILNRIPIFLVGKPGSSKTLTMQVIASNLQGNQSPVKFWKAFPSVHVVQYQCSPMSDSHSIQHQFEMAVRYQEHAQNTITVLLLDEVGLAEHSPDMPLKVLHGMLVDPPIAIVGLSNWVLDPAKMNRAICLQRTEPSPDDISHTGKAIVIGDSSQNTLSNFSTWLPAMARAYHNIYTKQKGRDFIGMRDYYHLLKLLRKFLIKTKGILTADILNFIVCRNFGGNPVLLKRVLQSFYSECFGRGHLDPLPSLHCVRSNIVDYTARHLMLLTKNSAAIRILFNSKLLSEHNTKVLIGSEFPEDRTELHLITQINEVKLAMASGSTIILLNHDNIYEALYDVLNQRYLYKTDKDRKVKKMLRLAIGSRSQLCNVAETFKIVIIVEKEHAYHNLSLPLLNRFEKQLFQSEDIVGPNQLKLAKTIESWLKSIQQECGLRTMQEVICGFTEETLYSLILTATNYDDSKTEVLDLIKSWFIRVMLPLPVITSPYVGVAEVEKMFTERPNLVTYIKNMITPELPFGQMNVLMTYSTLSDFHKSIEVDNLKELVDLNYIQLAEIPSEKEFELNVNRFLHTKTDENRTSLFCILCDPIACSQSLMNHAQIIISQQYSKWKLKSDDKNKIILFIVYLPPGLKSRERRYSLHFHHPWQIFFIDNLIYDRSGLTVNKMYKYSLFELCKQGILSLPSILNAKLQQAVSLAIPPNAPSEISNFGERVNLVKALLTDDEAHSLIFELIASILEPFDHKLQLSVLKNNPVVGSLHSSLTVAIDIIIIQLLIGIIRLVDTNFNMINFLKYKELWVKLARHPSILSANSFNSITNLGKSKLTPEDIPNTGVDGLFISKFPFSYNIIRIMSSQNTKDALITQAGDDNILKLDKICHSIFGDCVTLWDSVFNGSHFEYFYDLIATSTPQFASVSLEAKLTIYHRLLVTKNTNYLSSIAAIHTTLWEIEEELFHICSLINLTSCNPTLKDSLMSFFINYKAESIGMAGIAEIHIQVLNVVQNYFWETLTKVDPLLSTFTADFTILRTTCNVFIIVLSQSIEESIIKQLRAIKRSFAALSVLNIFYQEPKRHYDVDELKTIQLFTLNVKIYKPNSASYLSNITTWMANLISKKTISNFLLRYFDEIIFGNYKVLGQSAKLGEELCILINQLINCQGDHILKNLPADCYENLTLRRILLANVIKFPERLTVPISLSSTSAAQLYLQYYMDNISSTNLEITNEEISYALVDFSTIESDLIMQRLQALAKLLTFIKHSTFANYYNFRSNGKLLPLSDLHTHIITQNIDSLVFTLKYFMHYGGYEMISILTSTPNIYPWIPNSSKVIGGHENLYDPFTFIASIDEIAAYQSAYKSLSQSHDKLVMDKLYSNNYRSDLMLAIIFRSTITDEIPDSFNVSSNVLFNQFEQKIFKWIKSDSNLYSKEYFQFFVHCAIWAMKLNDPFWRDLLVNHERLKKVYIPTMPDDILQIAAAVLQGVGWYKCPNGHAYSVGECTRPMEVSRCYCGQEIGGENHVPVSNNERITIKENNFQPGYTLNTSNDSCDRIGTIPCLILRSIMHALLAVYEALHQGDKGIAKSASLPLLDMFHHNITKLAGLLSFSQRDTLSILHLIITSKDKELIPSRSFNTMLLRNNFETNFEEWIMSKYFVDPAQLIIGINQQLHQYSINIIKMQLGPIMDSVTETDDHQNKIQKLLWRIRTPASFNDFEQLFLATSLNRKNFPFLSKFLKEEEKLHNIKYIIDIIQWQSILFKIFAPHSITHQEAASITNKFAIQMLPKYEQKEATKILARFCTAFNECFRLVENIYECEKNPFINESGEVNLSGDRVSSVKMSPDIPITFSLPSVNRYSNDPSGYCTVQLLSQLQNIHFKLLEKFLENDKSEVVPIHINTPRQILETHLILYNRESILIPLLNRFQLQSLNYAEGSIIKYDFTNIEKFLSRALLEGKKPMVLVVQSYQYKDDLLKRSPLSALRMKFPQTFLSVASTHSICQEIDTMERTSRLMNTLELTINFLVSIPLSVDINTPLNDFILQVLMFDPVEWNYISTKTINQTVCLCHLQSLYLALEEQMHGSALDKTCEQYKVKLTVQESNYTLDAAKKLKVEVLVPILRDFITTQLHTTQWSPEASLKEYLTFVESGEDLQTCKWYEDHFPSDLRLKHSYYLYEIFSKFVQH